MGTVGNVIGLSPSTTPTAVASLIQTENSLNINCSQFQAAAHGQAHQHNKLHSLSFNI